jgi:hypothetical protein
MSLWAKQQLEDPIIEFLHPKRPLHGNCFPSGALYWPHTLYNIRMCSVIDEETKELLRFRSFRDSETHIVMLGVMAGLLTRLDWYLEEIYRVLTPGGLLITWDDSMKTTAAAAHTSTWFREVDQKRTPMTDLLNCADDLTITTLMSTKDRR